MENYISIIIPNYNGSATIGQCLEAAFASRYGNFEVVVVDDCSTDGSVDIARRYPCRIVELKKHSGAAAARNTGAGESRGSALFFTDADCLLREDALSLANEAVNGNPGAVIGGTYTPQPFDADFFSAFQSLFIHYSETKRKEPDYLAAHAMIMDAGLFRESGGFPQDTLPIPEDVKFSHILRRQGRQLIMKPDIQVTHVFNFTFLKSLRNAYRKAKLWMVYSLENRDLLADSGTASSELKVSGSCLFLSLVFALLAAVLGDARLLAPVVFLFLFNCWFSRGLLGFFREKGLSFAVLAALYYTTAYPAAALAGAFAGMVKHISRAGIGKS